MKTVLKVEGPNYVRIRRCTVEYVAAILFKIFEVLSYAKIIKGESLRDLFKI